MASRPFASSTTIHNTVGASNTSVVSGVTCVNAFSCSKHADQSANSLAAKNATNAIEIWADGAVWDTVANKFLFPGRDFNFGDLHRK